MATLYIAAITAWDSVGAAEVTLYFSSGTGYISASGDTPANTWYEPRIIQPAFMRRDAFTNRRTSGRSSVSFGELVLANPDGELDYMADYEFDGRAILLQVGTLTKPGTPTWATVLVGKIEQATFGWNNVTIRLRDRQLELDKTFQATKYAGTGELEGTADDLKGRPKPRAYGRVVNVPAPLVKSSNFIYQVNDGAVAQVEAVYDQGVVFSTRVVKANLAALENVIPPAVGEFWDCPSLGLFRLRALPAGLVTADVLVYVSDPDEQLVGNIINSIVTGPGGISSGDVYAQDITDLNAGSYTAIYVGLWTGTEETTVAAQLDILTNSIGAYWGFDTLGKFRVRQLTAPTGTAVLTLTQTEILSIDRAASRDESRGIPCWRVNMGWGRNYVTQTTDLAGGTTAARRAIIAQEFRRVTAETASIKTTHPLAVELTRDTVMQLSGNAASEGARLLGLYGVRRDMFEVSAILPPADMALIDINSVVAVDIDRYSMNGGRSFRVIGLMPDLRRGRIDLTLWG